MSASDQLPDRTLTSTERAEWERRFKARIVERCMAPLSDQELHEAREHDPDFEPWTVETATNAANAEFEAVDFEDIYEHYEDDPEGSADECLLAWSE